MQPIMLDVDIHKKWKKLFKYNTNKNINTIIAGIFQLTYPKGISSVFCILSLWI